MGLGSSQGLSPGLHSRTHLHAHTRARTCVCLPGYACTDRLMHGFELLGLFPMLDLFNTAKFRNYVLDCQNSVWNPAFTEIIKIYNAKYTLVIYLFFLMNLVALWVWIDYQNPFQGWLYC